MNPGMQTPLRILVPITPAVPFARLLRRAAWLARRCAAQLVLLQVGTPAWSIDDQLADDLAVTRLALPGDALHQILATARNQAVDLIMMAPHDKWRAQTPVQSERDFLSFARQSVIARVIEAARCPVWIDAGRDSPENAIARPLCHLTLQAHSAGILAQAGAFARRLDAPLTVAHATFSTDIHAPGRASPAAGLWQESFANTAAEKFARLQDQARTDAALLVENGETLEVLDHLVRRTGADLLMVGHWPQSERWRRSFESDEDSDVLRLIHYSRVPVLAFRAADRPGHGRDAAPNARQRLLRDALIALPLMLIFIALVLLAFTKTHPSLLR
jgi:nucleotide-binding universal stress UspA family protein